MREPRRDQSRSVLSATERLIQTCLGLLGWRSLAPPSPVTRSIPRLAALSTIANPVPRSVKILQPGGFSATASCIAATSGSSHVGAPAALDRGPGFAAGRYPSGRAPGERNLESLRCPARWIPSSRFQSSSSRCSSAGASATSSPSRCAAARARHATSSTRGRPRPTARRAPTTCSHASSRTSTRATRRCVAISASARAAGTATGSASRSPSSRSWASPTRREIEEYGVEDFNRLCAESVFEYLAEWNPLTERIGFWLDLEDAYRTLDPSYIESVWWALEQIHAKGLLYESNRVVPYCPRCGTALSSHEVSQGYQDVVDRDRLRQAAADRLRRVARGLDDDAVDAAGQPRGGGRPGAHLRARARRRRDADRGRSRWSRACSERTPR